MRAASELFPKPAVVSHSVELVIDLEAIVVNIVAPTILDLLGAAPLPVMHGHSLRPYLEGRRPSAPRDHIFSQYLENEEACVRTERHKFILCSGKRKRTDGGGLGQKHFS